MAGSGARTRTRDVILTRTGFRSASGSGSGCESNSGLDGLARSVSDSGLIGCESSRSPGSSWVHSGPDIAGRPSISRYALGGLWPVPRPSPVTGFRVRTVRSGSSRNECLTRRSSSEWKLMMATLPPGLRRAGHFDQEELVEQFELAVDGDPQGLEGPGGRVDRPPLAGHPLADDLGEPGGGDDRLDPSGLDDPPGDPPAVPFLPVFEDQVGQLLLVEIVDQVGGGSRGSSGRTACRAARPRRS